MRYLTFSLLVILCTTMKAQNIPGYVPQNGLIGYYPFSGNANDVSGNGNNGSINGATLTLDRFSNANSAYDFDGTNDYLDLGSNSILPTTSMTFSIWFRTNSSGNQELLATDQSWTTYTCRLLTNGRLQWRIYPNTSGGSGGQDLQVGNNYDDNNWHHYVATWNGTQMVLFLDGVSVASGAMSVTPVSFNSSNVLIGKFPSGVHHFDGVLDDAAFWNRALTTSEISSLYNSSCTATFNSLQDTITACGTDSVQLDAGSGFSTYSWSTGASTQATYVSSSGTYYVSVTDSYGCSAGDSVSVSLINSQIEQDDTTICAGDSVSLSIMESGYSQTVPEYVPQNGLIGYYPFSGNANDVSGNGNNGSINGATLTLDRFSNANSAYDFDGTNDYLDLGSNSILPTTSMTFSIWFRTNSSGNQELLATDQSWTTYTCRLLTNGRLQWRIYPNTSGGSGGQDLQVGNNYDDNNWHHYVATWNGTQMVLFLDGVSVASGAMSVTPVSFNSSNVLIGKFPSGVHHFDGVLDDAAFWNRALSAAEILTLYGSNNQYLWSTGDTTASIKTTPTQTTTYNVTITDGVGICEDSITITVSNPAITASTNPTDCQNTANGIISSSSSGGISPYQFAWSNSASTSSINSLGVGSYSITVVDSIGCSIDTIISITAEDTINPSVVTQNLTIYLDASGAASITAAQVDNGSTDNCSVDSLYLDQTDFDCSETGVNVVTLAVVDPSGNSSSATANITVMDTISSTMASQNLTIYLDASGAASITAAQVDNGSTDNCDIDSLNLDITDFDCSDVGTNSVTITAVDVNGNSSSTTADITVMDTISPTMASQNLTIYLDASGAASITAAQVDNGSTDNCDIDSLNLDITDFDCSDVGTNSVTITAVDVNGNSSSTTADITVMDTISPTMASQNLTIYLDASGAASITAAQVDNGSTDNCDIDSLNLDITDFDCSDVGTNSVTITAVDVNGNSSSTTADITVMDTISPTMASQNLTIYLDASGAASITAAQVDNGSTDNCDIDSLNLDITDFDCSDVGTNSVTITAVDVNGNSSSTTADITVMDTISPTMASQNLTIYLDASGAASITAAQVDNGSTDNCDIDSLNLDITDFDCSDMGTNSVTITAVDVNGNSSSTTADITVMDTISPTMASQNLTIYLDASGAASITAAQVDNGSTDNCDIDSLNLDITDFDCSDVGTNSVTITAVDVNGNSSSTTADITVMDTISPMMASQNLTIYLDASGAASITAANVDNGSTDNCSFDLSLSQSDFTCEDEGVITVALIGVDSSGNTSLDSFDVQVLDTTFDVNEIQGLDGLPQITVSRYFVDSIAGAVYQWSAVNGNLSANGASAKITWSQDSLSGQVSVTQTVEQGCSDSTSKIITLWLTGIDNLSLTEEINLFPNPTSDKVFISLKDGQLEGSEVRVYSNAGRMVLSESNVTLNQSNYEVDLSSFSAGQYNIVISSGGKSNQYKVILN